MNLTHTTFLRTAYIAGVITATALPGHAAPSKTPLTDWNYLPSHGQSLSVGWTANPVITTDKNNENQLMFKSGVRAYENGNDRSAVVPLAEGTNGPRGETPVSGAACRLIQLGKKQNPSLAKNKFICSATGVGGASIDAVDKGTDAYNRIIADLKAGKALADKEKKTYSMPAFIWTQGETDHKNKKSKEWYKEKMRQLIADIDADAKAITGQKNDVLCFGYQVGSHLNYYQFNPSDHPLIALAQLEMALDKDSRYIMTTPMYQFEYSDGVHLTAPMSRLYGEYVGYVMKRVMIDGVDWKPVHPLQHRIKKTGNEWTVDIQFYAPVPPMVLDTKAVDDPGNYGFTLVTPEGEKLPIKSVKIMGKDVVRLVTTADPSKSSLRYGMTFNEHRKSGPKTGPRGCLRDSQGNKLKAKIAAKEYRMDNWCPFFDYSLAATPDNGK